KRNIHEVIADFKHFLRESEDQRTGSLIFGVGFTKEDLEPWAQEEAAKWVGPQSLKVCFWECILSATPSCGVSTISTVPPREKRPVRQVPFLATRCFEGCQPILCTTLAWQINQWPQNF